MEWQTLGISTFYIKPLASYLLEKSVLMNTIQNLQVVLLRHMITSTIQGYANTYHPGICQTIARIMAHSRCQSRSFLRALGHFSIKAVLTGLFRAEDYSFFFPSETVNKLWMKREWNIVQFTSFTVTYIYAFTVLILILF